MGYMQTILNVIFTQMSAKAGFKKFGQVAIAAMFKELKQLNDGLMPGKQVASPVNVDSLPSEVREQAMEAVNLIKLKRNGDVKGRTCLNGSKQ